MTYANYITTLTALLDEYTPLATVREDDPTRQLDAVVSGIEYPAALVEVSAVMVAGDNISQRRIQYPTDIVVLDAAAYDKPDEITTKRNATLQHCLEILARLEEGEQDNAFQRLTFESQLDPIDLRSLGLVGWRMRITASYDIAITKTAALWP